MSALDWAFIDDLYNVLKPFNRFTKHVSEGRPTITTLTDIYFSLLKLLHQASKQEGLFASYPHAITTAVYRSLKRFNHYYSAIDNNITYFIASVLDPQIKGAWIQKQYDSGDEKLVEVRNTIHELYLSKGPIRNSVAILDNDSDKPVSILQEILSELNQDNANSNAFVSDIDQYFDSSNVEGEGIDDPDWVLNWWRDHEKDYLTISQVAQDYLSIPAAEVDCERLFSGGRDLIGLRRYSMKFETMRALMVLKHNCNYSNIGT
jgi:hypothetical protein